MTQTEWQVVCLGDVLVDLQPGFSSGTHNSTGDGIPHFRPMNVTTDGTIDRTVLKYVASSAGKPSTRLQKDDIVFNNTNSPELVGKTALFDGGDLPAFSNHMTRLRVDCDRAEPGYVALRLHQAWREGWFAAHCNNHVSQASIGRDVLKAFHIELPPIEIQRAITAFASSVAERRTSSMAHVAALTGLVAKFRRAILEAACSGRLTQAWRAARNVSDWSIEPASSACGKVQSGTTPKTWYEGEDGVPFLKVYNIVDQKLDFDYRPQFISPEVSAGPLARAMALPGDVLMNIVGPPLGKVAVVTDEYPAWAVNQALTIFRPSEKVSTDWLYIFLCSGASVASVLNETRGTVGQVNISLSQCRSFDIPVPSQEEQIEIADRVNRLLLVAESVADRAEDVARQLERSTQTVLAKAFRGEFALPIGGRS